MGKHRAPRQKKTQRVASSHKRGHRGPKGWVDVWTVIAVVAVAAMFALCWWKYGITAAGTASAIILAVLSVSTCVGVLHANLRNQR